MFEEEFYQALRSEDALCDPARFRQLSDVAVLRLGQLIPLAGRIARAEVCNSEIVILFRDSLDQFLTLYGSFGDAVAAIDMIRRDNIDFFRKLRASLIEPQSFSVTFQKGAMPIVPIPGWDAEIVDVPASRIVERRAAFVYVGRD